jgi:hypothetical protein
VTGGGSGVKRPGVKPDDSTKNGLAETPAVKSGPPAWFGPALLEARCKDLAERGHRLAKCAVCGYLLYEVEGVFIHDVSRAPLHVGEPTEIFDPAKNPPAAELAESAGCFATPWKPTVRERIARFIFPKRYVGEIPVEAMSPAVKWGGGDVLTTNVWVDVSFVDLLRLLCSRRLLIEVKTMTELLPGHSVSRSAVSVLPPQFLEPGPSGDWSPEDERDLFDLVAGVGGEAPEHPCANCTNPDCYKGFLPGEGGAGHGWPCPDCVAAARIDFRDIPAGRDDGKMSPEELYLLREAVGDHVGGSFVTSGDGNAVWKPTGGPVQNVGPVGPKGTEGWHGCAHPDCRNGVLTTGGQCPVCRRHNFDRWDAEFPEAQPPTGTKCVVCGVDAANAPTFFVRGAPKGVTPALWQCPGHLPTKGGAE